MTVKDFVADFSAVGDGQRITATASISGSTLTPSSNFFATHGGNPTGRIIFINALDGSGYQFPAASGPDSYPLVTITGYNSTTGAVTLDQSTSVSKTSVSMDIVWGTDNWNAFQAPTGSWRAYAQAQGASLAQMTVPDGMYCIGGTQGFTPNRGVQNALWTSASGNALNCIITPLFPAELKIGGPDPIVQIGLTDAGGVSARLQTVNAGAMTATLVDAATYGSRIVVGRRCIIAALDRQSVRNGHFGYPPNPAFYEYNTIAGYSGGVVTFGTPTKYSYKSTYTEWDAGDAGHADQGGPATIYVLPSDAAGTVEMDDISIYSPYNQISCAARDVILLRCQFLGEGLYPTQNKTFLADTCVYSRELEMDKIDDSVEFRDCTLRSIFFQSGSPNLLTITRGTIAIMGGTPTELVMNDVTFVNEGAIRFGAASYGHTKRVTLTNCTGILDVQRGGASVSHNDGNIGMNLNVFYSMSGGVLSFPLFNNQINPRFFVPGAWIFFDAKYIDQIVDTWDDGSTCFVQFKNLTGGWPYTPVLVMSAHPCPDLTVRGCSGSRAILDLNNAPARAPWMSYSKRTYDGIANPFPPSAGDDNGPLLFGKIKKFETVVSKSYGTAGALAVNPTQPFVYTVTNPDFSAGNYLPSIDLKVAQTRTVLGPGSVSGAQTNDSGLDPVLDILMPGQTFPAMPTVSGVSANYPAFTVEWITDQGIPPAVPLAVMPLRFRMHA